MVMVIETEREKKTRVKHEKMIAMYQELAKEPKNTKNKICEYIAVQFSCSRAWVWNLMIKKGVINGGKENIGADGDGNAPTTAYADA